MHDKRLCPAVLALSLALSATVSVHAQSLAAPKLGGAGDDTDFSAPQGGNPASERSLTVTSTADSAAQIGIEDQLPPELDGQHPRPARTSVNEALMEELGFTQDLDLAEQQTLLRRAAQTEELRLALDKVFYERQKLKDDNAMEAMRKQHEEDLEAVRDTLDSRVQAVRDHYRSELKKVELQVEALREAVIQESGSQVPFLTRITMYSDEYVGSFLVNGQVKQAATGDRLSDDIKVLAIGENGATVRTGSSEEIFLAPVPLDYARDQVREAAESAKRLTGLSIDYRALTVEPGPEFEWMGSSANGGTPHSGGARSDPGGWPAGPTARKRN